MAPPAAQAVIRPEGSRKSLGQSASGSSTSKLEQQDEPRATTEPFFQGDRCIVKGQHHGVVQYLGVVGSLGYVVGVLLDDPVGNSNGTHEKRFYFQAPPKYGGFFPAVEVEFEVPQSQRERAAPGPVTWMGRPMTTRAGSPGPVPTGAHKSKMHTSRQKAAHRRRAAATSRVGVGDRKWRSADLAHAGGWTHGHAASMAHGHAASLPPDVSDGPPPDDAPRKPRAAASQCVAAGRGLLAAIVKQRAQFTLTAHEASGARRSTGGDPFEVLVRGVLPPQNLRSQVHDHSNGTYTVTYLTEVTGQIEVAILLEGEHVQGSPFLVPAVTLRPDPAKCLLRGDALTSAVARKPMAFEIEFVDALGQIAYAEELDVRVEPFVEQGKAPAKPPLAPIAEQPVAAAAGGDAGDAATAADAPAGGIERRPTEEEREAQAAAEAEAAQEQKKRLAKSGVLRVVLQKASGLAAVDLNGKSDPYCILQCAEHEGMSAIKHKTTSPSWNEEYAWTGKLSTLVESGLVLNLYDADGPAPRKGKDDNMGYVRVSLEPFFLVDHPPMIEVSEPVHTDNVVVEALQAKGAHGREGATEGVLACTVAWEPEPEEAEEVLYDLVLGEERTVVGAKPLILRESVRLDSVRVHPSVKLAAGACVLVQAVRQTDDGVRAQVRVLYDSKGAALPSSPIVSGWITAVKDGRSRLARHHKKLHVNDRRLQLELWNKRAAADRTVAAAIKTGGQKAESKQMRALQAEAQGRAKMGPSFAHELADSSRGIAFAYGGVTPGTLHAHGHLLKTHQVQYSIGRAGKFQLHVGLRQQGITLPGSPFSLVVKPGPAHAPSSHLPEASLPLSSVVGTEGSLRVRLNDNMGNECVEGGANLRVLLNTDKVSASCEDQGDGTYAISWKGDVRGDFQLSVLLGEHHVHGSPAPLSLLPAPIDVAKCVVLGEGDGDDGEPSKGPRAAVAGEPARLQIRCQDSFGNEADPLPSQTYGLCLVGLSGKGHASEARLTAADRASLAKQQESLPFDGSWERPLYSLTYVPTEAGDFEVYLWSDPDGSGNRVPLPGSPFALHVGSGEASASGSYVLESNAQEPEGGAAGSLPVLSAGEKLQVRVQVRDAHGNNAPPATEGELSGKLEITSTASDLGESFSKTSSSSVTLKQLYGEQTVQGGKKQSQSGSGGSGPIGSFEIVSTAELTQQGAHELSVCLRGEHIAGSPLKFELVPGAYHPSKSKLVLTSLSNPAVNVPIESKLTLFDRWSNELLSGGLRIEAKAYGSKASECQIVDCENGSYTISFVAGVAGDYKVQVRVENAELAPLTMKVLNRQEDEAEGSDRARAAPGPAPS